MFSQLKYSSAVLVQQIVSVVIFWYSLAATVLCWHTKHNPHYICYFCFIRLRENTVVCFVWMNTGIEISGNICLYHNARKYKHSYIGFHLHKRDKQLHWFSTFLYASPCGLIKADERHMNYHNTLIIAFMVLFWIKYVEINWLNLNRKNSNDFL